MIRKYYISIDFRDKIIIATVGYKTSKEGLVIKESKIYKDLAALMLEIKYLKSKIKKKTSINIIYNDSKSENFLVELPDMKKKYKRIFIENKLKDLEDKDSILDYGYINKDKILISKIGIKNLKTYLKIFEESKIQINKIGSRLDSIIKYIYFYNYFQKEYILLDVNNNFIEFLYFNNGLVEIDRLDDILELDNKKDEIFNTLSDLSGIIISDKGINSFYDDFSITEEDIDFNTFSPSIGNIL